MFLVIVESPTKGNTIQKFLKPEYKVFSSYGHIRDLPKAEFGIDVKRDFEPRYVIPLKARKTIGLLKKAAEKADSIILATDEDREGEAIAWHLTQILQLGKFQISNFKSQINSNLKIQDSKPYQRIVFHEITKQAIENAIKNPRSIDLNLVNAQQARRILDRIVGYELSPFLWKKVAKRLSAGRVQSVAVKLVCDREEEIKKFIPQEYWSIEAEFRKTQNTKHKTQNNNIKDKTEFLALLVKKDNEIIPRLGIKTKKQADEILKDLQGAEYKITSIEKKEIKRNPAPPFTTSSLQQEGWQKFHWSAKMTMRVAQQLYEKGLTSYHRTDSLNLSDSSLFAAKKFIIENYGKEYSPGFLRRYKTKSKGAQEAHEAIRPTLADKSPEKIKTELDNNQLKLYDLIWRRFIASQMSQAVFDSTVVEIESENPKSQIPKYTFRTNGQILKFDGFLKIYPVKFKETELPVLEKNEILELIKLISLQHYTQPPARYNEASLIKALEENGIGRPSTYAPILSIIQERNYIKKNEEKKFQPTEIGIMVNDLLIKHFANIVDIKFTAKMEEDLDKIAQGKEKWKPLIKAFYEPFKENLEKKYQEVSKKEISKKKTDKKCPKCGSNLLIKFGRFGEFLACPNFPKCKHTESLEKSDLGIICPKCQKGKIVEKRTKKKKIFYGCSNWPECDFALWDKPTGKRCPKCDSFLVYPVRKRRGISAAETKCSNKNCVD